MSLRALRLRVDGVGAAGVLIFGLGLFGGWLAASSREDGASFPGLVALRDQASAPDTITGPAPQGNAAPGPRRGDDTERLLLNMAAERDFTSLQRTLAQVAARSPLEALRLWARLPEWMQDKALAVIVFAWLEQDPEVASDFIAAADPFLFLDPAYAEGLARTGRFDCGVKTMNRMKTVDGRKSVAAELFRVWQRDDREGFALWAGELTGELKALAMAEIQADRALRGSVDRESLQAELGLGEGAVEAWQRFAQRLIQRGGYTVAATIFGDGSAAVEWQGAMVTMAREAPDEMAVDWLLKIGDPVLRDRMAIAVASIRMDSDPPLAVEIAMLSHNARGVHHVLRETVRFWMLKDPEAARRFLTTDPRVPVDLRAELLGAMGGAG